MADRKICFKCSRAYKTLQDQEPEYIWFCSMEDGSSNRGEFLCDRDPPTPWCPYKLEQGMAEATKHE
jgi:hypothetical protein